MSRQPASKVLPGLPRGFDWIPFSIPAEEEDALMTFLATGVLWEQKTIRLFGRPMRMPREVAYFGPFPYRYSGLVHLPAPLPAELSGVWRRVERSTKRVFNTLLLNRYRVGADSMGWHSDNDYPTDGKGDIASLSLGAERRFLVRTRDRAQRWSIPLSHQSLLLMDAKSQDETLHSIPKTQRSVGVRYNLTFRFMASGN